MLLKGILFQAVGLPDLVKTISNHSRVIASGRFQILTLNFDLELSKLIVTFGADIRAEFHEFWT